MARLSVIIPVYQSAATLERAVQSVTSQGVAGIEILLVDDGSTDGGSELCDSLALKDPAIRVIHRANGGLSAARNTGIEAATAPWLAFIDSDDAYAPGTLAPNLEWLEQDPSTGLLEFPVTVHYGAPSAYNLDFTDMTVSEDVFAWWVRSEGYQHCYAWNKIYSRSLFEKVRYPEGETFEDAAICPTLVSNCGSIRMSSAGRYLYYATPGGITRSYKFAGQEPLFRHNQRLWTRVRESMPAEAAKLWSVSLNLLIDLYRCPDADARYLRAASFRLAAFRPSVHQLTHSGLPSKAVFKGLCASVFGVRTVCKILGTRKLS